MFQLWNKLDFHLYLIIRYNFILHRFNNNLLFIRGSYFFPNSVSFGVFSHSKGLGAKSASGVSWGKFRRPRKRFCGGFPQHLSPSLVCSSGTLGQIPLASKKVLWVLWKVPPTFLYICLPVFSSKKVIWKVPLTFVYICLPVFSGLLGPLLVADPTYVSIFPQQR